MEVQELRKERALPRDVDMQEVDENYVTRPPIVDLKVPQGLIDIMPHIEEDFYKSIGCEEETKEVIQACPRSSTMNYSPPPLNENITSAAKKTDATLYGIQIALAQATRPLDNFVYRKYREDAECAKEDEGVALASAMRLILANIATNISQNRMENVYQAMSIPGKPQQLGGTTTKPLFDQEQLDKAIATIKPVKRTRLRKPFQGRQQYGLYQTPASTTATAPTQQSGQNSDKTHYTTGFPYRPSSGRATRDVQESLGPTYGQHVGQEHRGEGVSYTLQNPRKNSAFDNAPSPLQEEAEPRGQQGPDRRGGQPVEQESNRRYRSEEPGILQSTLLYPEEDWRFETGIGSEKPERVCSREELQDGVAQLNLQADSAQGFHDIPGPERRISTHTDTQGMPQVPTLRVEWPTVSVQGTSIRSISITTHFHQGVATSSYLGTRTGDQDGGILGRPPDHRRVQGYLQSTHNHDPSQVIRTWIHSKPREVRNYSDTVDQPPGNEHQFTGNDSQGTVIQGPGPPPGSQQACKRREDHPQGIGKLHRKSSSHVSGALTGSPHAQEITGTQERHVQVVEFMDIDRPPDSTCPGEPPILEGPSGQMEWPIIPTGSSRAGNLYRCQRHSMGGSCGLPFLLWSVESIPGADAYQRQRAIDHIICTPAPRCCWSLSVGLLRQHNILGVHEETWRNYFSKASGDSRKNMDTLHGYQHTSSSDVCAIDIEPRRRTEPVDCSDRMVTFHRNIQSDQRNMGTPRCGHVCQQDQQESSSILQLVLRQGCSRTELIDDQMVEMEEPVLLPAVESDRSDCHEGQTRETDYNFGDPNVEVGDMVSRPIINVCENTDADRSNTGRSGSQKRKIPYVREQELVPYGVEDQRSTFEAQGISKQAIDLILMSNRRVKRRSTYLPTQQKFLAWHRAAYVNTGIAAAHVVNYLADIYTKDKLSVSTIKAYKSAICQLSEDPHSISEDDCMILFLIALEETNIKSFVKPTIDISPVIQYFVELGPTDQLEVGLLTAKTCWLLAICGFLRASDLHRIDDKQSVIVDGILKIVIMLPKEKRGGRPIIRPCEISSHKDTLLCPVETYKVYKAKVATKLSPSPHINENSVIVNRLFRYTKNFEKPLSVASISRYIQSISKLIKRPENTPIPKARAIGATVAANAGVSSDTIVTQAFWSSYTMFDNYYRLSRTSCTNLTQAILPLESLNMTPSNDV
ncbi:hypothetical protein AYI69_g10967 [Smittium culicis]|uniref:Tyr recombinase domain-containing protein n=5 Tax=Smittium culicis TaxID=133412 RepID=A0A1R1X261_9FUNG|nr:hypothetical protein AYI69_g10967 [Smittium culicis]